MRISSGFRDIDGPNWKVAYDGYLDLYHLPVLHRNTFGPDYGNKAIYDSWGPHQRVTGPGRHFEELGAMPEDEWPIDTMTGGVWTIFPHVSIASFDAGGKVYMVSQLYPGSEPGTSRTTQMFLHTQPPSDEIAEAMAGTMDFLMHVVRDEDYYTGLQRLQERGRRSALPHVRGRATAGRRRRPAGLLQRGRRNLGPLSAQIASSDLGACGSCAWP